MHGKVLVIRSASFQQLDGNLKQISSAFHGRKLWLLTHAHGKTAAEKYDEISKVCVYPYPESFSASRPAPALRAQRFEAVVVPVSNTTGAGFSNVFLFALTLNTPSIYMCNLNSEIKKIAKTRILANALCSKAVSVLSHAAATLTLAIVLPMLVVKTLITACRRVSRQTTYQSDLTIRTL